MIHHHGDLMEIETLISTIGRQKGCDVGLKETSRGQGLMGKCKEGKHAEITKRNAAHGKCNSETGWRIKLKQKEQ